MATMLRNAHRLEFAPCHLSRHIKRACSFDPNRNGVVYSTDRASITLKMPFRRTSLSGYDSSAARDTANKSLSTRHFDHFDSRKGTIATGRVSFSCEISVTLRFRIVRFGDVVSI